MFELLVGVQLGETLPENLSLNLASFQLRLPSVDGGVLTLTEGLILLP